MSDSPRPLTEEERQALRRAHVPAAADAREICESCWTAWPCPEIRLLDLLKQSEGQAERNARHRDGAEAEAMRLAERLEQAEARAAVFANALAAVVSLSPYEPDACHWCSGEEHGAHADACAYVAAWNALAAGTVHEATHIDGSAR